MCVYSMSWLSVCVWIRLKGGRDVKLDVHPLHVCVDLFADAHPPSLSTVTLICVRASRGHEAFMAGIDQVL